MLRRMPVPGSALALAIEICLSATTVAGVMAQDARALIAPSYKAGEQALHSGDLPAAETAFRRVLTLAPNDVGAHANLGVVYMRQRSWKPALEELETARRLAPKMAGIRLNIGLVYFRQEDYIHAFPAFESVVRDEPNSEQARQLLGLCYFLDERYADTIGALEPLWTASNTDLNYLYVVTIAAGKSGRHDLENRALERLIEVGKDSAELHLFLGRAFLARGQDHQALVELAQAEKLAPLLPFLHYYLGLVYKRQHDFEKARQEFLKDRDIEPDVAYDYDELGMVSAALGDDEAAERYFREAVRRDARLGTSWYGLAKVHKQRKKYGEALTALEAAGKIDPESASVHYLRAQVLLAVGKKAEALEELSAVRKLQKETTDKLEQAISGGHYHDPQIAAGK
jgi:tetratricopeptide (TPR) repeat protein